MQFVLGADHAFRDLATDLAFLDGDVFVAKPKLSADGGHEHLLACRHVGRAAHDVQRFLAAAVYGGDVQVVGVGVVDAGEHLAHDDAFQGTFHRLEAFQVFHFKACGGQYFADFLSRIIAVDVLFQPIVGDFHIVLIV